ncbi:MAG: S24 family peptidase [Elusimicrobia bacterium]|nr:S24 family peptidase [Elusimicrobiota bacterium]
MLYDEMSLRRNLERLMAAHGVETQRELAKLAGVDPGHLNQIFTGKIEMPKFPVLKSIADALGVQVDELVSGTTSRIEIVAPKDHDDFRPVHSRPVPIEAIVAGGDPREAEKLQDEQYELLNHLYAPGRYVIRLFGDSMWPTYHDGDLLLVDSKAKTRDGETAVVRIGGESTVKRIFRKKKGGGLILKADNPTFPPIETDDEEVDVIAKVLKIVEGERS